MKQPAQDTYWWSFENEADVVVNKLMPQNDQPTMWSSNAMVTTWYRNTLIYYSNIIKSDGWDTGLNFKGRQGELIEMLVPMARSLTRQLIEIVTKQKLSYACLADKTAMNVVETARLGDSICKQVIREQKMDLKGEVSFEHQMLTGMCFTYVRWRTDRGEFWATGTDGLDYHTGDVAISSPTVWDVSFDPSIPDHDDWQWVQVREIANRWDLIAQHPELKDELLAIPSIKKSEGRFMTTSSLCPSDEDNIYVYAAYHKSTPALEGGRMVAYCSDTCIIFDGPNIYGRLPVYVSRPEVIPHSGYGYPFFSSLVPAQEMLDVGLSALATNNAAFAVQNVAVPRGSNLSMQQINGMNFFTYTPMQGPGGGKPEAIQLTESAPETYKFTDLLKQYLMELSKVNSALRGEPPPQVSSGTAIATLTATALETILSGAKSWREMIRQAMFGAIDCYKRFASVERDVQMGNGTQTSTKGFVGADLDAIRDITISETNPLMSTLAGRIDIADKVAAQGYVKNLKGYFAVLEGAPPEEMYKNELSEEDLVNRENEAMLAGEPVIVVNIDNHPYHMMMHAMLLNDPKIRLQPGLREVVLGHILEHYTNEQGIDPMFAAIIRTGAAPQGMMMPPPAGEEGGGGAPSGNNPSPSETAGIATSNVAEPADDKLGRTNEGAA